MPSSALSIKWPTSGTYIVAVSGGADSVALLDLLHLAADARGYKLVVAHFDHGTRPDSALDAQFVRELATRYEVAYEQGEGQLGPVSEATAREARYAWLDQIRDRHGALGIMTAHHADDVIETSLLNLARGTGRHGLAPMETPGHVIRPLLRVPRQELRAHAADRRLSWREDPTNQSLANPRNLLRHELLTRASASWQRAYRAHMAGLAAINRDLDQTLAAAWQRDGDAITLGRTIIDNSSLAELQAYLHMGCRVLDPSVQLSKKLMQQLALFAKIGRPGRYRPVSAGLRLKVSTTGIVLEVASSPNSAKIETV